jgi:GntR family transcriptional regulator
MNLKISNTSNKPIYEQITTQIKNLIVSGRLKEGEALPSMRLLAKELRVSVITTKRAYEDLEREGFIQTLVGKGSFVAKTDAEKIKRQKLHEIDELIYKAVEIALSSGISYAEVSAMLDEMFKENTL